jgi:hypothetical protein
MPICSDRGTLTLIYRKIGFKPLFEGGFYLSGSMIVGMGHRHDFKNGRKQKIELLKGSLSS